MTGPKSVDIVLRFVAKVVLATFAFLAFGCAAIAVSMFNTFARSRNLLPPDISYGMTALENLLFAVDGICFSYFLIIESIGFLRDMTAVLWRENS
jgi:hypothetical protein